MKIVVDARMVGPIGHGVARYVQLMAEGLRRLHQRSPLSYELLFLTQRGIGIPGFACREVGTPFLHPAEIVALPRILREERADLYHSPSFSSLLWAPCPWLVTVHDLIHLEYGSRAQRLYYELLLKRFIRRARAVATVSEFSRMEIARWAGISAQSVEVVYNAIEKEDPGAEREGEEGFSSTVLEKYGLRRGEYFLCLSNSKPHKNVPRLIEAYSRFRMRRKREGQPAWPLVLTARGLERPEGVHPVGSLDQHEAGVLLRSAGGLVYPSLLEGFGRPPLEAALERVPVAVSRIPPHEEAMSDFTASEALWVDPHDTQGWNDALERMQQGEPEPAGEETRRKILEKYSIARMGADMDRIYRKVLKQGA